MRGALLALTLLAACAQAPVQPPQEDYLSGTSWRRVDDDNAMPHPATLTFEDGRASGYTGCNRWFGDAVQSGGDGMRFENVTATEMACAVEAQMTAERNFLAVIRATRRAHYDDRALVLFDAQDNQIAHFENER